MVEWNMYSVQTFRYILIYAVFHNVKTHYAVAQQKWFLIVRLRTVANKQRINLYTLTASVAFCLQRYGIQEVG